MHPPFFACRERRVFHACEVMNFRNNRRPGEDYGESTPTTDAGGESRRRTMDRQRLLRIAGVAGIGPVALAGVVGSGLFIAHANQDSGAAGGSTTAQQTMPSPMDEYIKKLAANLGIDEQKLRDALKATSLQEIDAAVAAGKLTQAQADRIKEAINSGKIMMGGGFGGPHGHGGGMGDRGPGMRAEGGAEMAAFLGITEEQLRTEMTAGKTLAQVAEAHGKTRDQLKAFLIAENVKHIDAAVADGRLTADQAAKARAAFAAAVDTMIDATMPAKGGRFHMDGGRGMTPGSMAPGAVPGSMAPGTMGRGLN